MVPVEMNTVLITDASPGLPIMPDSIIKTTRKITYTYANVRPTFIYFLASR